MEGASGGFSAIFETTKTKLLVLSSLLGVGAIYYMTKNYLQQGYFFPSWYSSGTDLESSKNKKMTVIGGKGPVVIKENLDTKGRQCKRVLYLLFQFSGV